VAVTRSARYGPERYARNALHYCSSGFYYYLIRFYFYTGRRLHHRTVFGVVPSAVRAPRPPREPVCRRCAIYRREFTVAFDFESVAAAAFGYDSPSFVRPSAPNTIRVFYSTRAIRSEINCRPRPLRNFRSVFLPSTAVCTLHGRFYRFSPFSVPVLALYTRTHTSEGMRGRNTRGDNVTLR